MTRRTGSLSAWIAVVGVLSTGPAASADDPPSLRFDPFRERPEVVARVRAPGRRASERSFEPVLLSTVTGGKRAVANLGGEIITIGEETHGYRLIAVGTFEAIFVKDGQRIRLDVVGRQEADR